MRTMRGMASMLCACSVMLALSACGSSSSSSTTNAKTAPSGPATTSTPAATSSTSSGATPSGASFRIGQICSCSGVQAAALGDEGKVSTAWADSVNAAGGISGHPVKMIVMDDAGSPSTALKEVKTLVAEHIQALIDDSLADGSFASYISSTGIPVVGGTAISTPFLTNPDFFTVGSNLPVETVGQAALGKHAGLKKLGVMYCSETPLCAEVVPLAQLAATLNGLGFASAKISSTAPSYAAPCLAFKGDGVDALFVADNGAVVQRVQAGCVEQGYKPLVLNSTTTAEPSWLNDPNFKGALLAATNANYKDPSIPGVKLFLDAVAKYDPGLTASAQFDYDTIYPWAGGELFEAAAKAGNLTPTSTSAEVKKGLYALKNETLDGLAPPLNFIPGHPGFSPCYFTTKVADGKFVSLNGGKPTCLSAAATKVLGAALAKLG